MYVGYRSISNSWEVVRISVRIRRFQGFPRFQVGCRNRSGSHRFHGFQAGYRFKREHHSPRILREVVRSRDWIHRFQELPRFQEVFRSRRELHGI